MTQEDMIRSLLRRWGWACYRKKEIARLKKAITEELDAMTDVHPQPLTGMPHSTNVGRPTEENAFRRMAAEQNRLTDLEAEEERLDKIIEDAEWAVSFLPDRERHLISLHYVEGLSMESIAASLFMSVRHAWRIERRSIRIIANFKKMS